MRARVLAAVEPTEEEARRLIEEELAKPEYADATPSIWDRLAQWFNDLINRADGLPVPLAVVAVVAIVVVAGVVILVVAGRVRVEQKGAAGDGALFEGQVRSAAEHRRLAAEHAQASRWAEAVREMFRAIVRDLTERTLVDDRPGLTADEAAHEAGARLPGEAAALLDGARLFDAVTFGGRSADQADYERLSGLDTRTRSARPAAVAMPMPTPMAAPR